jgi:thiol-disulfide isomerase/thioredoxin
LQNEAKRGKRTRMQALQHLAGVLVSPARTFREVAERRRGFGLLFALLAVELLLVQPIAASGHAARATYDVGDAVVGLVSMYRDFVLKPAIVSFAAGLVVYYVLRRRGVVLDPWTGASLVAYAWVPHTLLVAASVLAAALGLDGVLAPHRPTYHAETPGLLAAKLTIAFAPTAALALYGVRTLLRPAPAVEAPPPSRSRTLIASMGSLVLLLVALGSHAVRIERDWASLRPALPDDALPAFTLRGLDGGQVTDQDLRGSVALLDFWATWCGPCVASMPHLEKLHQEMAPLGLRLVSVNTEPGDLATVRSFVKEKGLTFPVWVDGGALQSRLRVQSYPTMLLVDAGGVIRHIHIGSTSMVTLRSEIETLLASKR